MVHRVGSHWGYFVKSLREAKGLKQAAIADFLGVDQTTISRWERGKDVPSLAIQRKLIDMRRKQRQLITSMAQIEANPTMIGLMDGDLRLVEAMSPAVAEILGHSVIEGRGKLLGDREHFEQIRTALGWHTGDVAFIRHTLHRQGRRFSMLRTPQLIDGTLYCVTTGAPLLDGTPDIPFEVVNYDEILGKE